MSDLMTGREAMLLLGCSNVHWNLSLAKRLTPAVARPAPLGNLYQRADVEALDYVQTKHTGNAARFIDDPSDPRHGSTNGYANLRCRCERCRESWRASRRAYYNANPEQIAKKAARQKVRKAAQRKAAA